MGKRERELFDYRDGALYWKKPTSNRVRVGDLAGGLTTKGYYVVAYDKKKRMLHRVIWDYFNDEGCAGFLVDHKNRDPSDNRIENLRLCNYSENAGNARRHRDNSVGLKGVHRHKDGRFRAQIMVKGKKSCLGVHDTPEEAHAAYLSAAKRGFGGFHHGGEI